MLRFTSKLDEFVTDMKVKRLTKKVYDAVDRLIALQPVIDELKQSFEARDSELGDKTTK